ncbi:MAG: dipeptidase [Candidatus Omnitrophica bacterium]|nr:dipeptidase [Candidatus Omnitrophota bacterium]
MDPVKKYVQEQKDRFVKELAGFLRIPSVSAKSERREACRQAADFLLQELGRLGFSTSLHETPGHPIVTASRMDDPAQPTVLIYGHYDVQPEEPLDLWTSPPFEPRIVNGNLYARGASDDKGQLYAHIKAVETLIRTEGKLPVNVTFLLEGEEEIASTHLEAFIEENREILQGDVAVISDSSQYGPGMPAICYGLRGICADEIRVQGANRDLHSGSYGGAVPNPCNVLCEIIAKLKDETGRIQIPGFYEDVLELEAWEREAFAALAGDDEDFRRQLGVAGLHGEEGYTTLERKWARPTLDVNGLFGGYSGEGAKTIIPAWAGAKITMRLVPNQQPDKIRHLFREYVRRVAPAYVTVSFVDHSGGGPVRIPRDAPFMNTAVQALEYGFGRKPVFIREGGSIPVVSTLERKLGLKTLLLGFGLPDDNAHAPDEKFSLADYERGILTSARFLQLCAKTAGAETR